MLKNTSEIYLFAPQNAFVRTLKSLIKEYIRLFIWGQFSSIFVLLRVYSLINFWEFSGEKREKSANFQKKTLWIFHI